MVILNHKTSINEPQQILKPLQS